MPDFIQSTGYKCALSGVYIIVFLCIGENPTKALLTYILWQKIENL